MARKPSARVVLNRSKLDVVHLAIADGVEAIARTIVTITHPPDATPYGQGLVTEGGWLVYSGPDKVAGGSLTGNQPKKPRALQVQGTTGIVGIAGFGFPGRFQEVGTARQPARPFLMPSGVQVAAAAPGILRQVVGAKLASVR